MPLAHYVSFHTKSPNSRTSRFEILQQISTPFHLFKSKSLTAPTSAAQPTRVSSKSNSLRL